MNLSYRAMRGMLETDILRMFRDRFLLGLTIYLMVAFPLLALALPAFSEFCASQWKFDLSPHYPLIVSFFTLQQTPYLSGFVGGFLLLESRENSVLKALLVSPNTLTAYLTVMSLWMFIVSFVATVLMTALMGRDLVPRAPLILISLSVAPLGPMFALWLATVSKNKVQAFAYLKLFGFIPIAVTACFYLPEPWQYLAAVYPPFSASKAYWIAAAGDGNWVIWIFAGIVGSVVWLGLLCRLLVRTARE